MFFCHPCCSSLHEGIIGPGEMNQMSWGPTVAKKALLPSPGEVVSATHHSPA